MQGVLIGMDIGGTHIRVMKNQNISIFNTKDFSSFHQLLELVVPPSISTKLVCALAGPIDQQGGITPPNIRHWGRLDPNQLEKKFPNLTMQFMNDLVAHAKGIDFLGEKDLHLLKKGTQEKNDKILLIAPGTGLGVAFKEKGHILPSEAGHTDWPVYGDNAQELQNALKKKYGHISYERVISGTGLEEMQQILKVDNVPKVFTQNLARFIANMTVTFLPDVVYLGGGILKKHVDQIDHDLFKKALLDQGRFNDWVDRCDIFIILDELTGLKGAYSVFQH
jgi:glucokinase